MERSQFSRAVDYLPAMRKCQGGYFSFQCYGRAQGFIVCNAHYSNVKTGGKSSPHMAFKDRLFNFLFSLANSDSQIYLLL